MNALFSLLVMNNRSLFHIVVQHVVILIRTAAAVLIKSSTFLTCNQIQLTPRGCRQTHLTRPTLWRSFPVLLWYRGRKLNSPGWRKKQSHRTGVVGKCLSHCGDYSSEYRPRFLLPFLFDIYISLQLVARKFNMQGVALSLISQQVMNCKHSEYRYWKNSKDQQQQQYQLFERKRSNSALK